MAEDGMFSPCGAAFYIMYNIASQPYSTTHLLRAAVVVFGVWCHFGSLSSCSSRQRRACQTKNSFSSFSLL